MLSVPSYRINIVPFFLSYSFPSNTPQNLILNLCLNTIYHSKRLYLYLAVGSAAGKLNQIEICMKYSTVLISFGLATFEN